MRLRSARGARRGARPSSARAQSADGRSASSPDSTVHLRMSAGDSMMVGVATAVTLTIGDEHRRAEVGVRGRARRVVRLRSRRGRRRVRTCRRPRQQLVDGPLARRRRTHRRRFMAEVGGSPVASPKTVSPSNIECAGRMARARPSWATSAILETSDLVRRGRGGDDPDGRVEAALAGRPARRGLPAAALGRRPTAVAGRARSPARGSSRAGPTTDRWVNRWR